MRIALVAPPFISVPPKVYGGTELFIAHLAEGLKAYGLDVVVYANGESTVAVEKRCLYSKPQWPIHGEVYESLKDLNHTSWAVRDAMESCDVIHLNNAPGLVCSRFTGIPFVYTVHHPHVEGLSKFYSHNTGIHYVTISDFQRSKEKMPNMRTIHHGIDTSLYLSGFKKREYLSFLGRIAPVKGTHLAIQVAQKTGIPLKIAGEVQPMFRDYFEQKIKPHLDGKLIEYVGEVGLKEKNELLGNSLALLFPILWDEPFGLVMVEAMACGAPVLALPGGSVPEIVRKDVSGYICESVDEMADRARNLKLPPSQVRAYVEENFSLQKMVAQYAKLYAGIAGNITSLKSEDEPIESTESKEESQAAA